MATKKDDQKQVSISIGDVSNNSGDFNVAGGDITVTKTTTGLSAADVKQLFDQVYARIDAGPEAPPAVKEDLKAEVQDIQTAVTQAVQQDAPLDETFLGRRFRNIARMAPDILDVVVATVASPLGGLGIVLKKIAERAKEETAGP